VAAVCQGIRREDLLEREEFKGDRTARKNRVALNAPEITSARGANTAEWIEILPEGKSPAVRSIPSTRCSPTRR